MNPYKHLSINFFWKRGVTISANGLMMIIIKHHPILNEGHGRNLHEQFTRKV